MYKILQILVVCALIFSGCEDSKSSEKNIQNTSKVNEEVKQPIKNSGGISIKKGEKPNDTNQFISYDIHGQKKVDFGLDKNETSRAIGALVMVRNPYEKINLQLLKGRLSKNFILKCSACHDDYANGIIGPSLLQKNKDEIYNMIRAYKHKEKVNVLMKDLVLQMSDEEIMSLAKEIDEFNEQFRSKK